ncbi:hypothetical protein F5Y00DRAFT_264194 [Daldinia vernicosa]|uniref:uncharacterized protein n=1 Tax=Daldinia vernicosa TaxID=114800 RepID=UPI0020081178|nr:uncharacterized protein F5Y00DRAFT_264194 [Daldinia vernicosa]KAI0846782.1 hypothetical protein F5Y00DRAFT_264194 [Daldinia vernicosa]
MDNIQASGATEQHPPPIIKPKSIDFAKIQHIFPPGTLVFSRKDNAEIVSRVLRCQKKGRRNTDPKWKIDVEHVDWNGEECGYREYSFTIDKFDGDCRVTELNVFPISYLADEAKVRAALIERGRKFEQLRGYRFRACRRECSIPDRYGRWYMTPAGSKMCVDSFAYYKQSANFIPKIRPLEDNGKHPVKASVDESETASESVPAPSVKKKRMECLQPLTDEQRLMVNPWLKCFDIQIETWCRVLVDDLEEVNSSNLAFEKLHLPDNEKNMILNLVKGKLLSSNLGSNDPVRNQGHGITCLMLGPSGVGKAFTAKAIADKLGLPLYSFAVSDFKYEFDTIVDLRRAMELCDSWGGILLLKGADCLVAARKDKYCEDDDGFVISSFELIKDRNYTGILFLTANETIDIDPDLIPHINHFLPFSPLGIQTRRQIWRDSIEHIGKDNFICGTEDMEEVLNELSEFNLNGHEIHHLVNCARIITLGSEDSDNKVSKDTLCILARNRIRSLRP